MAKQLVTFSLDPERDRRIVRWLEGLPKRERSKAIRDALHTYLGKGGITLGDIYEAIQELKQSGIVVTQAPNFAPQADIPADVLERLDKLGL